MKILQGMNHALKVLFNADDDLSLITKISGYLYFRNSELKKWSFDDVTINNDEKWIAFPLSEEETMAFEPTGTTNAKLEIKFLDDENNVLFLKRISVPILNWQDSTVLTNGETVINDDCVAEAIPLQHLIIKKGADGKDGSDAEVTTENIVNALGYTPADESDVSDIKTDIESLESSKQDTLVSGTNIKTINGNSLLGEGNIEVEGEKYDDTEIKESLATETSNRENADETLQGNIDKKIDKPSDTPTVGKVLKIKSVNEDGTFVCEWADESGGGITDVQVNGETVVDGTVANIPYAISNKPGVVRIDSYYGLGLGSYGSTGVIIPLWADDSQIDSRYSKRMINPSNFVYALKSAMSSTTDASWTSTEQKNAQSRLGIIQTTKEEYDLITTKGTYTIYILTDTKNIYVGETQIL